MCYSKPTKSLDEMIELLRSRGMEISPADKDAARHALMHANYYRLSAYWYPFRVYTSEGERLETFQEGTRFADIARLYMFDRELRLELIAALDAIEISFRGVCAYHLAQTHGPSGYLDRSIFKNSSVFNNFKFCLQREIERAKKDPSVAHFKKTYGNFDEFPVWMATEIMSFGTLSKLIDGLKSRSLRNAVAHIYGLDESFFCSMMHHLVYIRNICAHHGRIWNKDFVIRPKLPKILEQSFTEDYMPSRIYATLIVCDYLGKVIQPDNSWLRRIKSLLDRRGNISLEPMGFPESWESMSPWRDLD